MRRRLVTQTTQRNVIERLERRQLLNAGQLDVTFGGGDGRAPLSFAAGEMVGVQPDGKIIVKRTELSGFRLARLNADGTEDATFLGGARLTQATSVSFEVSPADGKIAFIGKGHSDDTIVGVFNADGSADVTFDGDGLAFPQLGYVAKDIAWHFTGLVLLGGPFENERFDRAELIRLHADGARDESFGASGGAKTLLPLKPKEISNVEVMPDGRIVLAATYHVTPSGTVDETETINIYRFTAGGLEDDSFASGAGFVQVDSDVNDFSMRSLAFNLAPDGSIVHLANSEDGVQFRRYDVNGTIQRVSQPLQSLVPSWGYNNYLPDQIEVQPDGKVLLIGPAMPVDIDPPGWTIVRLETSGALDLAYGANGITLPKIEHTGVAALQPEGKLVIVGDRFGPEGLEAARVDSGELNRGVIRLNGKGTLWVEGTAADEAISLYIRGRDGKFIARVGEYVAGFAPSKIKRIAIWSHAGNDTITINNGVKGAYLDGGDGFDTLTGGQGGDVLIGGVNADQLFGLDGNDTLVGNGGADYLLGGAGNDDLFGNGGVDTLSGAGGNDRLFGGPNDADRVLGGNGTDAAAIDDKDSLEDVETLLSIIVD